MRRTAASRRPRTPVAALASSGSARRASRRPPGSPGRPTSTPVRPARERVDGLAVRDEHAATSRSARPRTRIARAASGAVFVPSGTAGRRPGARAPWRRRGTARSPLLMRRQRYRPHGGGYDTAAARSRDHDACGPGGEQDDDGPHPAARIAHAERERSAGDPVHAALLDALSCPLGGGTGTSSTWRAGHCGGPFLAGEPAVEFEAFREANDGELW